MRVSKLYRRSKELNDKEWKTYILLILAELKSRVSKWYLKLAINLLINYLKK